MENQDSSSNETGGDLHSENTPSPTPIVNPKKQDIDNSKIKKLKIVLFLVFGLIIVGGGIWFIFSDPETNTETTEDQSLFEPKTLSPTPVPSPTPLPVDRSEVNIEVLNGTGIAREATYLQGELRGLEYTDVDLDNFDSQDKNRKVTTVSFSTSLPEGIVDEITKLLEDLYEKVEVKLSSSLGNLKVQVVTGLRKDYVEPSATTIPDSPTPTPDGTPTPSPSSTLTPTPAT